MKIGEFKRKVWDYYEKYGRHDLPWRQTRDPYSILVSEIMLQQTQVSRVLPKYEEFLKKFPDIGALAEASAHDVLLAWQGLGYNRRALALKRAAETIRKDLGGRFPRNKESLVSLPGIGPYTAGALRAFIWNEPEIFFETNIRAAYLHSFFPDKEKVSDDMLLPFLEKTLDEKNPRTWYYALMDYGSHLKKLHPNPTRRSAHHAKQSPFKGSNRELRSYILRAVLQGPIREEEIIRLCKERGRKVRDIRANIADLAKEGFIQRNNRALLSPAQ